MLPNLKTTGKLPFYDQSKNMLFADYLDWQASDFLWSGCLDAPRLIPAGCAIKYDHSTHSVPWMHSTTREQGVNHA